MELKQNDMISKNKYVIHLGFFYGLGFLMGLVTGIAIMVK